MPDLVASARALRYPWGVTDAPSSLPVSNRLTFISHYLAEESAGHKAAVILLFDLGLVEVRKGHASALDVLTWVACISGRIVP